MKKLSILFTALLLLGTTVNAETNKTSETNATSNFVRGYGNSFIFMERGIEFSIFPDGQFDFYMPDYGPRVNAGINTGNVSISFNSGFDYNPFIQYDSFGAIIQIENVPIFYDFYGRIIQAGNVRINYNGFGRVAQVGGLFVHYNRFNAFSHYTGFINPFNRFYVYRPWHRFFVVPSVNFCVVYNRPYRQFYRPIRHTFYRPYRDNFRPQFNRNYNAGRRGAITRNEPKRSDRYRQSPTSRRQSVANSDRRGNNNTVARSGRRDGDGNDNVRPRGNGQQTRPVATQTRPKRGDSGNTIRNKPKTRPSVTQRPQNTRPVSNVQKPRTQKSRKSVTQQNRIRTNKVQQRSTKPRSNNRVTQRTTQKRSKVTSNKGRSSSNNKTSRSRRGIQ